MSTRRQRVIRDNFTHTDGRDLGDVMPAIDRPHQFEDLLIEVLHDAATRPNLSIRSVDLRAFREFLRHAGPLIGWNPDSVALCLADDDACEATVHFTICKLKRLEHLQEWSANWLLRHGLPLSMLPDGQEYLGY